MLFPSASCFLQAKLGATCGAFDLAAACSGFVYALSVAEGFVKSGIYKNVLAVGAETISKFINWKDRGTCVLFGDGAGAVLLEPSTDENGYQDAILKSDGSGRDYLHIKAGGSLKPASVESVMAKEHYAFQDGQPVFKFAVKGMADVTAELLEKNELTGDDITWLVPHKANLRIIDATANRAGIPAEKVMINIQKYGNTTAATIPLCLWEWESQLKKGDNLILAAFGGGFTWGAAWVKWAY
jgi:3-oxoacyl-[acyl-carrier-protein] synthase-3